MATQVQDQLAGIVAELAAIPVEVLKLQKLVAANPYFSFEDHIEGLKIAAQELGMEEKEIKQIANLGDVFAANNAVQVKALKLAPHLMNAYKDANPNKKLKSYLPMVFSEFGVPKEEREKFKIIHNMQTLRSLPESGEVKNVSTALPSNYKLQLLLEQYGADLNVFKELNTQSELYLNHLAEDLVSDHHSILNKAEKAENLQVFMQLFAKYVPDENERAEMRKKYSAEIDFYQAIYRRVSLKIHPDKNQDPDANQDFVKLTSARNFLTQDAAALTPKDKLKLVLTVLDKDSSVQHRATENKVADDALVRFSQPKNNPIEGYFQRNESFQRLIRKAGIVQSFQKDHLETKHGAPQLRTRKFAENLQKRQDVLTPGRDNIFIRLINWILRRRTEGEKLVHSTRALVESSLARTARQAKKMKALQSTKADYLSHRSVPKGR